MESAYSIREGEGPVMLCAEVVRGNLQRNVSFVMSSEETGNADGMQVLPYMCSRELKNLWNLFFS